jgi:hypothetical protein
MLGSIYRSINRSLVDAEKLLTLLNEPTDVNDKPGAPDLVVLDGEIEFGRRYCFPLPRVDLMQLQKTLGLRTMAADRPYVAYPSGSPREDQLPSSASPERASLPFSAFSTDSMT